MVIHTHPLIFEHQLGDVLRVEAIDIFGGIDVQKWRLQA